ncbi:TetR/AcrR family transcriptional regulator [Kribbella sandramycini]|uniref:AcrR family transcriptional regulator n=1 Tax=Kribbella sandramycini TaxID=60450 RepID=A0A841S6D4_9ACTN|nr:TetR/AcrR family transcriptional regulator [Kribbella sandramycini]MBB6567718.1 AcrR family transcriptional regulator [Kribbella sandramycini]
MSPELAQESLDLAKLPKGQRERRRRIVDAAVRALSGQDYHAVQIKDIAEDAGVALGTLYRYFSSKDHLYAAAVAEWGRSLENRAAEWPSPGLDRLRRKCALTLEEFRSFPELHRVYQALSTSTEASVRALAAATADAGHRWLAEDLDFDGTEAAHDHSRIIWGVIAVAVQEDVDDGDRILDRCLRMIEATTGSGAA